MKARNNCLSISLEEYLGKLILEFCRLCRNILNHCFSNDAACLKFFPNVDLWHETICSVKLLTRLVCVVQVSSRIEIFYVSLILAVIQHVRLVSNRISLAIRHKWRKQTFIVYCHQNHSINGTVVFWPRLLWPTVTPSHLQHSMPVKIGCLEMLKS